MLTLPAIEVFDEGEGAKALAEALAGLPCLKQLSVRILWGCPFLQHLAQCLAKAGHLECLDVWVWSFDGSSGCDGAGGDNIVTTTITGGGDGASGFCVHNLRGLKELHVIASVDNNEAAVGLPGALQGLTNLFQLRFLTEYTATFAPIAAQQTSLTRLCLENGLGHVTNPDLFVASLPRLANLQRLSLPRCNIDGATAERLAHALEDAEPVQLWWFDVSNNLCLGDRGGRALAPVLAAFRNLSYVDLSRTGLSVRVKSALQEALDDHLYCCDLMF